MSASTWLVILAVILFTSYVVRRRIAQKALQDKVKDLLKLAFALRGRRVRATVAPASAGDQFGDFLLWSSLYLQKCGAITGEANFEEPPELEIGISLDKGSNKLKIVAIDLQDEPRTELKIDSPWPNTTQREIALEATSFLCTFERLALSDKLSHVREVLDGLCVRLKVEPEHPKEEPYPKWVERLQTSVYAANNRLSRYGVSLDSNDRGTKPTYEVALSYESQTDSLSISVSDLPLRRNTSRRPSRQWLIHGDVVLEGLYVLGRFIQTNRATSAT